MKKKILSLMLTAVLAMGLAVGCGPADNGQPADGTATTADGSGDASTPAASTGKELQLQCLLSLLRDGSTMVTT